MVAQTYQREGLIWRIEYWEGVERDTNPRRKVESAGQILQRTADVLFMNLNLVKISPNTYFSMLHKFQYMINDKTKWDSRNVLNKS